MKINFDKSPPKRLRAFWAVFFGLLMSLPTLGWGQNLSVSPISKIAWSDNQGLPYKQGFEANYGVNSFTVLENGNTAFLANGDNSVKIFDANNQLVKQFSYDFYAKDIAYAQGIFYILGDGLLAIYRENGQKVREWQLGSEGGLAEKIIIQNEQAYLITSNQETFIFQNGKTTKVFDGCLLEGGVVAKTLKTSINSFDLLVSANSKIEQRLTFALSNLACAILIGGNGEYVFVDVQTIEQEIPLKVNRSIKAIDLKTGKIVAENVTPDVYYIYQNHDVAFKNGRLYHAVAAPSAMYLFNLYIDKANNSTGRTEIAEYPAELVSLKYHYNSHLITAPEIVEEKPTTSNGRVEGGITRSQALANVAPLESHTWSGKNTNIRNNVSCGGKNIKTPPWVINDINAGRSSKSLPYQWGGEDNIAMFNIGITKGESAGDVDTNGGGADACASGVDCSGLVCIAWQTSRAGSSALASSTYSTPISITSLQRADVLYTPGHIMLVYGINSDGSLNIIESSGIDQKVSYRRYTHSGLQTGSNAHGLKFTAHRYNNIIEDAPPTAPTNLLVNGLVSSTVPTSPTKIAGGTNGSAITLSWTKGSNITGQQVYLYKDGTTNNLANSANPASAYEIGASASSFNAGVLAVGSYRWNVVSTGAGDPARPETRYFEITAPTVTACTAPVFTPQPLTNGSTQTSGSSVILGAASSSLVGNCAISSAKVILSAKADMSGSQISNATVNSGATGVLYTYNSPVTSQNFSVYWKFSITTKSGQIIETPVQFVNFTGTLSTTPTTCQSVPTVSISTANPTVFVGDAVTINYSVAAGTNCSISQVNFVNATTGANPITGSNTSYTTSFPAAGTYNYTIQAKNSYGTGISDTRTITVNPKPLVCVAPSVSLSAPANGSDWAANSSLALSFMGSTQNPTACPILGYEMNIYRNGVLFLSPTVVPTLNNHALSNMQVGTYQWEVRAKNQAGYSPWSERRTFTVTDYSVVALAAPVLETGSATLNCISASVNIASTQVSGASIYEFLIADNPNMNNAQVRASNSAVSARIYAFNPQEWGWARTYYVKARVYSANNAQSPLSNSIVVSTASQAPDPAQAVYNITAGQSVSIAASNLAAGALLEWYNAQTGGLLLYAANNYTVSPTTTTTYWVSQFVNGCKSSRTPILVNVTSPTLTVSLAFQNVPYTSGAFSVGVQSNVAFTASSNVSWLTISGQSSTGFMANFTTNTNAIARNGVITITAGGITRTVNVTQDAQTSVNVSTNSLSLANAANSQTTLNVVANATWAASGVPADLTLTPASGSGNATVTVKANTQNPTANPRIFTFNIAGNTVTVTQAGTSVVPPSPTNLATDLVLDMPMNGNAQDISGKNNQGIVNGATPTTDRNGNVNSAYLLNDNSISVSNSASLQFSNAFSYSIWIKLISTSGIDGYGAINQYGYHPILSKNCDRQYVYSGIGTGANNNFYYQTGTWNGMATARNVPIQIGQWMHLSTTYDGERVKLFLNGQVIQDTLTQIDFTAANATDLIIGKFNCWGYYFNGAVDDLKIWNRALTDAEVQTLYGVLQPTIVTLSAPTSLTATAVSASQVNLAWTNASATNVTGIQVEMAVGNGAFSFVTTLPANATSYNVTGLQSNTLHRFRVRAVGANSSFSDYSNIASATTQPIVAPPTGSDPFGNPLVTNVTHTVFVPANLSATGLTLANNDVIALGYMENSTFKVAGKIIFTGVNDAFNAYGDDTDTPAKDGFTANETFAVRLWKASENKVYNMKATYSALDATFTHQGNFAEDGISGLTNLTVVPDNPDVKQTILIKKGNNYVGLYVIPAEASMVNILAANSAKIRQVKNSTGKVYLPSKSLNQIGNWKVGEGYQITALEDFTLTVTGKRINVSTTPIALSAGWNLVAYTQQGSSSAVSALASINTQLVLVKDEIGRIYSVKPFVVNKIGDLLAGKAYYIKTTAATTLTYPAVPYAETGGGGNGAPSAGDEDFGGSGFGGSGGRTEETESFAKATDNNASVLIEATLLKSVALGSRIEVVNQRGEIVGGAIFTGENLAFPIYGADEQNSGLKESELFDLQVVSNEKIRKATIRFDQGNAYQANGIFIAEKLQLEAINAFFTVYPNPFREKTNFQFTLNQASEVSLEIFNTLGQKVHSVCEKFGAGENRLELALPQSGLLLYRFHANGETHSGSIISER